MRLGPKIGHGKSDIEFVAQLVGLDPNYNDVNAYADIPKSENLRQLKRLLLLS